MEKIKFIVAQMLLVLAVGCATAPSGLPSSARLVGGGLLISWEAPEKGTAVLIEKHSGKTVETRSLAAREKFTFDVSSTQDAQVISAIFGAMPEKAIFQLYFIPWR
jgi:hypothetical protein